MLPRRATASASATIGSGLNSVQVKQRLAFLKTLVQGPDATSSLRSRAVHSGAWIGIGFGVQKVLQLSSNLILTRLLFPEAFGLMALATVFLVGLAMFSDIGLKPSVIRDPRGDQPAFLNTAWTIQVIRGLAICLTGMAIAYPLARIYDQPTLFPLLAVLSMTAAIAGFTSIGMVTAERRLNFRIVTIVQVSSQLVSILLLIGLAYFWRSVWALAVANVLGSLITVLIGHAALPPHRHQFAIDRRIATSLVNFGRWILFSTLATYLAGEGLKAIQGGLLSPTEFGVLAIAYTIAGIPNDLAMKFSGSLGMPVIAEAYRNAPHNAYFALHGLRLRVLAIALMLFAGVMLAAEPLIRFLYDARYHQAGVYLVILSLANAIAAVTQGYTAAMLAIGKASSYFNLMSAFALLRIIGVVAGFEVHGIIGMLFGIAVANIGVTLFVWVAAHRISLLNLKLDLSFLATVILVWVSSVMISELVW